MKNYFLSNLDYLNETKKFGGTDDILEATHNSKGWIDYAEKISEELQISLFELFFVDLSTTIRENAVPAFDMLVLDVDGVMTDGGMYVDSKGVEAKKFNTKDGMAIKYLRKKGIPVGFLSSGLNAEIIEYRAKMLDVDIYWVGKGAKLPVLQQWSAELKIPLERIAYLGDDINDLELLPQVGLFACPIDSCRQIISNASMILKSKGGEGAVREFVSIFYPELI